MTGDVGFDAMADEEIIAGVEGDVGKRDPEALRVEEIADVTLQHHAKARVKRVWMDDDVGKSGKRGFEMGRLFEKGS